MKKEYTVRIYMDYTVEAKNREKACEQAETLFCEDVPPSHCGLTEIFNIDIIHEKEIKKRQ